MGFAGHLNILMALEHRFAERIAEIEELAKAHSVEKLVRALRAHALL